MGVRDLVPGNWYITIVCDCGERLFLFADLTEGKGSLQGAFNITCPTCRTAGTHPAQRYRHEAENYDPQEGSAVPVKLAPPERGFVQT